MTSCTRSSLRPGGAPGSAATAQAISAARRRTCCCGMRSQAFAAHPANRRGPASSIRAEDRALFDRAVAGLDSAAAGARAARRGRIRCGSGSRAWRRSRRQRVLIHDGARPFLDAALIDRVMAALDARRARSRRCRSRDTIKRGQRRATSARRSTAPRCGARRRRRGFISPPFLRPIAPPPGAN